VASLSTKELVFSLAHSDSKTDATRRGILKILVLFGGSILLIPLSVITDTLFSPELSGPVEYPKVRIANSKDLRANSSLLFEYPHKGRPAILIHLISGDFAAYDASCTHLGCQIHYNKDRQNFCPCHGGTFDPETGKVLAGPPRRPLPKIRLEIDDHGDIYADGYESGLPLYGEE
jgi:arsenite oxidase small subunit